MKRTLGKAAAATAGAVGVAAAANRSLAGSAGELAPPLAGETDTYRWRGVDVAYTEAGDPDDPDVLLVHGINAAGTSKEFEPVFESLAEDHHVIAPDLPGFGRSDRPPLVYSAALYESMLAEFAREVTENPTCIASSLSSAYVVGVADEVDFEQLVLVCPTTSGMPGRKLWLRTLLRSPVVGTGLFNLIASKPSIEYFGADHGYYDVERKPEGLAQYQWQSAHRKGARYAPASFVSGYLNSEVDLEARLSELDVPVTLAWGREAEITPLSGGRDLAEAADCRLVVVDYAKLQPHAEHPEKFLEGVADDL
jgi:pimeloyl-ACP methyl ester carboxylesterase